MSETTITFRVDATLKFEFAQAAKAHDRVSEQLLRDFMRDFIQQQKAVTQYDDWFHSQVQTGLNSANAGDLINAEEVEAEAAAWRDEMQKKLAGTTS
ncbi:MAG: hypothetical protein LBF16_07200 [Pseudomonadales bacterium]|jgi:predicted transcriptional regulator|nr:hypothetical protein [Pseudomonadales bacterium]